MVHVVAVPPSPVGFIFKFAWTASPPPSMSLKAVPTTSTASTIWTLMLTPFSFSPKEASVSFAHDLPGPSVSPLTTTTTPGLSEGSSANHATEHWDSFEIAPMCVGPLLPT